MLKKRSFFYYYYHHHLAVSTPANRIVNIAVFETAVSATHSFPPVIWIRAGASVPGSWGPARSMQEGNPPHGFSLNSMSDNT